MKKIPFIALIFLGSITFATAQTAPEKPVEKTTELNEVAIIKTKKAIEQKADRTIFNFVPSLKRYLKMRSM